jgi:hypothetical protein
MTEGASVAQESDSWLSGKSGDGVEPSPPCGLLLVSDRSHYGHATGAGPLLNI